ncbi:hypothetical protein [Sedimentitalea todarodis]|uniref:Apolipoprotein acyltransferase n=1 Tax=Sedimentitalea todarodis TaxID=1631240 RepID=A0ABU3VB45_9RHOB|nr:hypothetical protein [Sedimentitalea todarodis]MDU9003395.1 hypothetical protein [Sedimentitalea todarodis]
MIVIAGVLLGAVFGVILARKGGGKAADMAQYAAASAMAFGIVAMIATVLIDRLVG